MVIGVVKRVVELGVAVVGVAVAGVAERRLDAGTPTSTVWLTA
jgi:hypothetical protein